MASRKLRVKSGRDERQKRKMLNRYLDMQVWFKKKTEAKYVKNFR
jgi:hypothetical protein